VAAVAKKAGKAAEAGAAAGKGAAEEKSPVVAARTTDLATDSGPRAAWLAAPTVQKWSDGGAHPLHPIWQPRLIAGDHGSLRASSATT
jgi:hypothetical protein